MSLHDKPGYKLFCTATRKPDNRWDAVFEPGYLDAGPVSFWGLTIDECITALKSMVGDDLNGCHFANFIDDVQRIYVVDSIIPQFQVASASAECPDCRGTGKYVGLNHVEPCAACKGSGSCAAG